MQFLSETDNTKLPPCAATIGFFDGVHRGHQFLIEQVKQVAAAQQLHSLLVTFVRHPREVMQTGYRPQLLSTPAEKRELLTRTEADFCAELSFTEGMSHLSAREFMQMVLRDRLNVRTLVIGYDHRFGHNRTEGFADYVRYGEAMGVAVLRARACEVSGLNVSSSAIRAFLDDGQVELASRCLGRNYTLQGRVVGGFRVGRTLGFPTANLVVDNADKLVPATGVYAVRVWVDGTPHAGMLNIGTRPTLADGGGRSIEVHILHFNGNLYEQTLRVAFVKRLRDEKKFRGTAELSRQLEADANVVEKLFENP